MYTSGVIRNKHPGCSRGVYNYRLERIERSLESYLISRIFSTTIMATTTATTITTTTPTPALTVPRGPVEVEIAFIVPRPGTEPLFNYVETPPDGQPPRNFDEVPFKITLTDIRGHEDAYNLEHDAFQVLPNIRTATTHETYYDDEAVQRVYYPEVEKLLLENVPGAHKVVIFDHTIRRQGSATGRQPVTRAHVDQSTAAAAERVRLHISDKDEAEELLKGRFRIINVWRPINGTVVSAPLGFADSRSIDAGPEGDLLKIEHRYPHRTGEIMGVKYNEKQRWLYLSGMEGEERLLLKCADSAADEDGQGAISARAPHSSFVDPRSVEGEGGKPRESIEVRTLVFG